MSFLSGSRSLRLVPLLISVGLLLAAGGCGLYGSGVEAAPVVVEAPSSDAIRGRPGEPALVAAERSRGRGGSREADGRLPDGATVDDVGYPGIDRLDPSLLAALRRAADAAARNDVRFEVNSGWRSKAYQERLLDDAVDEYGSREEAARWVATPETSPHVSGEAVDLGTAAADWLSRHGAAYGLCQVFANEPWHYELRPAAVHEGCPAMYRDPTEDPRFRG